MTNRTPYPLELQQFNTEICCLLQKQSPDGRSLFLFIKRSLRGFHLEGTHTEIEVFNEAYMRGVALTLKGNTIRNPKAWIRKTAFNVIRELSREAQRCQPRDSDYIESSLVAEEIIELDIEAVLSALQELELSDRLLIELKTVQNLSWKEVGQTLVESGEKPQTEAALRKRGQRAMQRLRQIYHQSRPSKSPVS